MRTLRIIIILAVLIGFPAISWIYLNSGLKWRIKAQEETEKSGQLPEFSLTMKDSGSIDASDLMGMFHIMAVPQDSLALRHLDMIHEQFQARPDFRIIQLEEGVGRDTLTTTRKAWIHAICMTGCDSLYEVLFADGYTSAIVDDSLYVRGRYHLADIQEMRRLTEHMAVVLPIEKRERIELIRGDK